MGDLFFWDDLKRELIALLAGVIYLAVVRLIQRYKPLLDRWLKPDEVPDPPQTVEKATQEEEEAGVWLDQLKDEPPTDNR